MKAPHKDSKQWLKMIGRNLKEIRTARKELIPDVSEKVKISPALLETIEKGEYDMDLGEFAELCHHYGVQMADIVSEDFKHSDK